MVNLVPEKIKNFSPYAPNLGEYEVRSDANESPYGLSEEIKALAAEAISKIDFNRYPDPTAFKLKAAYGKVYGVNPEFLTVGNGSDELIGLIVNAFCSPEDKVATASPDFSMYKFYSSLCGIKVCDYLRNGNFDIEGFSDFVNKNGCKIAIFSNPCNPTGEGIERERVLNFIKNTNALCVIDEAYMDFWDQSIINEVDKFDNALVLRTLSKSYGAAALRVGFAVANRKISDVLSAVKSPYNVNSVSQAVAEIILRHGENKGKALRESAKKLKTELEKIIKKEIPDTKTNFVYIKTDKADKIKAFADENKIAIRSFSTALRITAGTDEENEKVCGVICEYLKREKDENGK